MSHRFLIDANLPVALSAHLIAASHNSIHVLELPGLSLPDRAIWDLAGAQNRTIVTRDSDFVRLVEAQPSGPAVIWIRLGNVRKKALLARLAADWNEITRRLEAGQRLIEIY
jgi:predicted nuclease of predicted toxin-antitoxin system